MAGHCVCLAWLHACMCDMCVYKYFMPTLLFVWSSHCDKLCCRRVCQVKTHVWHGLKTAAPPAVVPPQMTTAATTATTTTATMTTSSSHKTSTLGAALMYSDTTAHLALPHVATMAIRNYSVAVTALKTLPAMDIHQIQQPKRLDIWVSYLLLIRLHHQTF